MKFRVKSTLKYSVQRMTPTKAVRIALLVISDALILNIASFLALWVRFEFHFEQLVRETEYLNNILRFAPYYTAFGLIVFALFKLYTSLWQFASIDEFLKIILACFIVDAGGYAGMHLMHLGIPRSHPFIRPHITLRMRRQKGIRDNRLSLPMPFIRPDTELMQIGFRSEKVPISRRSVR